MEYMYHSRAKGKAKRPHGAESAGPVSGAGNMQLLNAMGADSVSDSGLEAAMGARFSAHFEAGDVIQMKRADEPEHGGPGGGSPADIISDLQQRSGVDLSDVKIHRNSPAPAAIDALAYAKGADVFLGPGQERHLGHELTHVVQQKQGLVRANDSVSGMPVNTSPVLEQAADAMSVSAAPETGFAGEGVVQGVFVDPSGKKVSKSDLKSAKKMLKGSMDSILETAQSSLTSAETKKDRKRIERALKKAKKQVGKRLKKAQKSKDEVDLGSMMTEIMDDAYGQMGFDKSSSMPAQKLAADSGSQQALTAAFPDYNEKLRKKDTQEGLQESMGGFQLPTEAAEGIGDIGEYDPASDKMEELLDARMGNSGTLMAQENETPEHRAAREKSSENFKNGAEAARQGAAAMREDPENISAGGLFQLFSNINENVRGGEGGGALRGKNVTVGQLATPGPAALPEDAYRTFAGIAAQMQDGKLKRKGEKMIG